MRKPVLAHTIVFSVACLLPAQVSQFELEPQDVERRAG
jgi:hypothetical protein